MASAMPFSYRQPPLATINPKPKLLLPCAPMPVISARCAAAISIGEGRSTLSQLIWFVKMSGTSFRRRRLGGSGRFLCVRSAVIPGMRNILRHGICCDSPSATETLRPAQRNFRGHRTRAIGMGCTMRCNCGRSWRSALSPSERLWME